MYTTLGSFLLLNTLFTLNVHAQFFYHQRFSSSHKVPRSALLPYKPAALAAPHQSVVQNSEWESQLPPELLKSEHFYNNPYTAAALAKQSLLTNREMVVIDREAEKIPREEVFKLFKNAGWIKRK